MQSRGLVIHGIDIKQSSPITDLRGLGFSGLGRQSRVSGPRVDEKRDWLSCHGEKAF